MYTRTGSGVAKSDLSVSGKFAPEEQQLVGFIIVSAKSSSPLYTQTGK
jgi:hypothetical protein